MAKSVRREDLLVDGPAGQLELLVEIPEQLAEAPSVAVICHPHPAHAGAMTNKVVHTLARASNLLGVIAVRFNFRGVGKSAGSYDEGIGELDDALAVIDWAKQRWPDSALSLAGFSFGSDIALRASHVRQASALTLVAPPVGRIMDASLRIPEGLQALVVQGGKDELVDPEQVLDWVNTQTPGVTMVLLDEADHFFHGQLPVLREHVMQALNDDVASGMDE